ncbi:acetylcholinesterase/Butyrylcholinesterase [Tothia fuscella]|uniref:Carboxylic ester hydrolase n=1 Tax=Tothia fuscella TaxID=1048955 RepID=A0A9P4NEE8_9PEZI|nr:acetylcholinesterase/Butyrylcholinesterase [Tothia fuscella]
MFIFSSLLFFLPIAYAVPVDPITGATSTNNESDILPRVKIQNGTIIGQGLGAVEDFKGIPYAQAPVGPLRLRAPLPLNKGFGTMIAPLIPNSCPQFITSIDKSNLPNNVIQLLSNTPFVQVATQQSEDCLNLNVQRPAGTTSKSNLPVVVYFFGGAFELGSTQLYDGSSIITKSMILDHPILYVAVNYRVAGFGFLAGKEIMADGSSNLGLRDQRLALKWVQDNIAAFGGDPTKVTIWGESAGAISAFDHTIINGGDNSYGQGSLFHGVIMNSGSIIPAVPVNHPKAQTVYDQVAAAAGCGWKADSLACLRKVPYQNFLNAQSSVPGFLGYRSVDLAYLPRPDPSDNFFPLSPEIPVSNGAFTKVPIIIGDQEDEGTIFSLFQKNITTTNELVTYLTSFFPEADRSVLAGLVATYPNNPAAGSPFGTGLLYNIYPQYKRLAAILGDAVFTLTRRGYLSTVSSQVPSWSFLSTYLSGTPVLGTFHASDVLENFFDLPSIPAAVAVQNYYISFINYGNPNSITKANDVPWQRYDAANPVLLNVGALGVSTLQDTFRKESGEYLVRVQHDLRI